jgi:hypothetical protein
MIQASVFHPDGQLFGEFLKRLKQRDIVHFENRIRRKNA